LELLSSRTRREHDILNPRDNGPAVKEDDSRVCDFKPANPKSALDRRLKKLCLALHEGVAVHEHPVVGHQLCESRGVARNRGILKELLQIEHLRCR